MDCALRGNVELTASLALPIKPAVILHQPELDKKLKILVEGDSCLGQMLCDAGPQLFRAMALELFGGSARLTKCLCDRGLDAIAVDWVRNASRPEGPCCMLDLTNAEHFKLVLSLIKSGRVKYVHMAPPCGTASRAREIPVKGKPNAPKPLRSAEWPDGLPGLKGSDLVRVVAANCLYEACFIVALECIERHSFFLWKPS